MFFLNQKPLIKGKATVLRLDIMSILCPTDVTPFVQYMQFKQHLVGN